MASSSSWSNLPLDLLLQIKKRIQGYNLSSFRSVCRQWRSAIPVPDHLPLCHLHLSKRYASIDVSFRNKEGSIFLPTYARIMFLTASNNLLIYITRDNKEIIHLFDPVSSHELRLPPLSIKRLYHDNKSIAAIREASHLQLLKAVVSSNADGNVAVACIIKIFNRATPTKIDKRFAFYRHGGPRKWNLVMEESKGIADIELASADRFYAVGHDLELYMLDEKPPLIQLKKLNLWLPKKMLEPPHGIELSTPKSAWELYERLCLHCCRREDRRYWAREENSADLVIYGRCMCRGWIALKLNAANLCDGANNVDVACKAECFHNMYATSFRNANDYFTPSFRKPLHKVGRRVRSGFC